MHTGGELVVSKEWLARCMRTYYTDLYNYGTRFTRNEQLVKHCIHELFMGLWQSRHMTGEIKDMKFYLLREIKDKILTSCEPRHRKQHADAQEFLHVFSIDKLMLKGHINPENSERLQNVLAGFSCCEKEVVYLKYYQHINNAHIAALMNLSQAAVSNILLKCLLKLSTCFLSNITLPR